MDYSSLEKVVCKAKNNDINSLIFIIKKYENLVFKKSHTYNIPGYNFLDLVQHGYLSIIKAIRLYKIGNNCFHSYVVNSINNNYAALLKGTIKHFREIPDNNILNKNIEYDFTLEDELIAYGEVKKLYKALEELDPVEKQIIKRHYLKEESFSEIAWDMDLEYNRVTYLKCRSLKKLRTMLEEN